LFRKHCFFCIWDKIQDLSFVELQLKLKFAKFVIKKKAEWSAALLKNFQKKLLREQKIFNNLIV